MEIFHRVQTGMIMQDGASKACTRVAEEQTRTNNSKKQVDSSTSIISVNEQRQHGNEGDKELKAPGNACPQGYFFKGYLAWSLWGHIPIVDSGSTTMPSTLPLKSSSQDKSTHI